jgi:hypothetical protein
MIGTLQRFFTAQAVHFNEGRIDAMARPYCAPLPVWLDEGYYLLRSRADVAAVLRANRDRVAQAGLRGLRVGVLVERRGEPNRMTAEVEWFFFGSSGRREARTRVRYYVIRHDGRFAIEMIELLELAFPEILDWYRTFAGTRPARRPTLLH